MKNGVVSTVVLIILFGTFPVSLYLMEPCISPQLSPEGSVVHFTVAFAVKRLYWFTWRGLEDVYVPGSGFVRFTTSILEPLIVTYASEVSFWVLKVSELKLTSTVQLVGKPPVALTVHVTLQVSPSTMYPQFRGLEIKVMSTLT